MCSRRFHSATVEYAITKKEHDKSEKTEAVRVTTRVKYSSCCASCCLDTMKNPYRFTVAALKILLAARGLLVTGAKADLISRMMEADREFGWTIKNTITKMAPKISNKYVEYGN